MSFASKILLMSKHSFLVWKKIIFWLKKLFFDSRKYFLKLKKKKKYKKKIQNSTIHLSWNKFIHTAYHFFVCVVPRIVLLIYMYTNFVNHYYKLYFAYSLEIV